MMYRIFLLLISSFYYASSIVIYKENQLLPFEILIEEGVLTNVYPLSMKRVQPLSMRNLSALEGEESASEEEMMSEEELMPENEPLLEEIHDTLNLSSLHIRDIADEAFNEMQHIKTLDLSNNELQDMPNLSLWNFSRLEHLSVAHNNISNVTNVKAFNNITTLKSLDMSYNRLMQFPKFPLWNFTILENLTLAHNKLSGVIYEEVNVPWYYLKPFLDIMPFDYMPNLRLLDLSYNRFKNMMVFEEQPFRNLINIEYLSLAHNQLPCNLFTHRDLRDSVKPYFIPPSMRLKVVTFYRQAGCK